MRDVHIAFGVAVLATNGLAAVWGGVAWLRKDPSIPFWYLLRVAQATVVVQVILGLLLLARGDRAGDDLHFLYGISPLAVALVTESMRAGAAQRELDRIDDIEALPPTDQSLLARRIVLREMAIMTVGLILIVTLALRAMAVGF